MTIDANNRIQHLPPTPDRHAHAHKGTFGTVIVIGGSATMMGAPALSASAALRAGAGLVRVAASADILPTVISIEPGVTGLILDPDTMNIDEQLNQIDPKAQAVLAVGPGLGQSPSTQTLVMQILQGPRTIVLDADGLNLLAQTGKPRPTITSEPSAYPVVVMTPHPGEYRRLAQPLGIDLDPIAPSTRPAAAIALANAHRATVVLKGQHTIVTDGGGWYQNTTGNPAMATAGSGDVLTGLIAALIAQRMSPRDASILGVYLHGLAGDLWAAEHGCSGLIAQDLANLLPTAFQQHRKTADDDR